MNQYDFKINNEQASEYEKQVNSYSVVNEFMETDQRASEYEKQVNGVVINVKIWTGGHGFTSGVSPIKNTHMMGKQITAGQLTRL